MACSGDPLRSGTPVAYLKRSVLLRSTRSQRRSHADHRRARHPSSPDHLRLRRSANRRGASGEDPSREPAGVPLLPRHAGTKEGRLRPRGDDRLALHRRGAAKRGDGGTPSRPSRDAPPARSEAPGQDRPRRCPVAEGSPPHRPPAGILDPARPPGRASDHRSFAKGARKPAQRLDATHARPALSSRPSPSPRPVDQSWAHLP